MNERVKELRTTPPARRRFSYLLVKQCRLIFVQLAKDCPHECLADEAALVLDAVLRAETVQHLLLAVVKENGDSMFARGLHRGLEIQCKFDTRRYEIASGSTGIGITFYRFRYVESCLLEGRKDKNG